MLILDKVHYVLCFNSGAELLFEVVGRTYEHKESIQEKITNSRKGGKL